jgi:hypothetical protein
MFAHPFSVRLKRARLALALLPAVLLWVAPAAHAQFGAPPTTQVHDASALKPPAGARVAIVEFEDLECPDCARANPLLKDAADKYHIPWIRHDFPLPMHSWSFQAAVNARFFDTIPSLPTRFPSRRPRNCSSSRRSSPTRTRSHCPSPSIPWAS